MSTTGELTAAIVEALTDLALADGLRDVRNVQGDLLAVLGVPSDAIVDCQSATAIEDALREHGLGEYVAWAPS